MVAHWTRFERMPAYAYPTTTRINYNFIVHVQRYDRCAANGCQTYHPRPRGVPGKVFTPHLGAWVKEGYNLACQRITGCGDAAFEFVATPTGKAEVVKRSWAALRLWNDVVNRHGLPGVRFGGVAIHAPPIVGGEKLLSQVGEKVMLAHAASRNVSAGGT